jgi:pyruvate dehydrogenase E1 component alpha subunit
VTPTAIAAETLLDLYERMITIRVFEERVVELFAKGLITGSTHPCIAQEAISAGACAALRPSDIVLATYRGHGAAIAKGCELKPLMAEMLTRTTGCCRGRGGSMHLCDVSRGFYDTNAIVAAHIPIAGGVALSVNLRHGSEVVVCFFGDGASCEGEFYETLNMAQLWKVPLILICENNGYAISVPAHLSQSTPDIADRAKGFGMRNDIVDGNDPLAVMQAVGAAAEFARAGRGPSLIECKTVRWERHSAFSSGKYANPEEALRWKQVDPLPRLARSIEENGVPSSRLDKIGDEAVRRVEEAVHFAMESPLPAPESVYEGIFAE